MSSQIFRRCGARLRAGRQGFDFRQGSIYIFAILSRQALGFTQPPTESVPGVHSSGIKQPRRDSNHSPPSSYEVKNVWSYISTPPYVCMARCIVRTSEGRSRVTVATCEWKTQNGEHNGFWHYFVKNVRGNQILSQSGHAAFFTPPRLVASVRNISKTGRQTDQY
jgi:hypothetical protein